MSKPRMTCHECKLDVDIFGPSGIALVTRVDRDGRGITVAFCNQHVPESPELLTLHSQERYPPFTPSQH